MLTTIIFSKDRPLQLDLTLKSLIQNWPINNKIVVIYKGTTPEYESSYKVLEKDYNFVGFYNEYNYNNDNNDGYGFKWLLEDCIHDSGPYLMFLTDDNIFYRKAKTTEVDLNFLFSGDTACLSLRLGINITHRDGYVSKQPDFERLGWNHLLWNRMTTLAQDYFNYPLSVDGHVFKKDTIKEIIYNLSNYATYDGKNQMPSNPNKFEQILQRYFFEVPAFMVCELYSCVVNSPNNRVQNTIPNLYGQKYPYDPSYLLSLFNEGFRIKLEDLDFSNIVCPHQEINIITQ